MSNENELKKDEDRIREYFNEVFNPLEVTVEHKTNKQYVSKEMDGSTISEIETDMIIVEVIMDRRFKNIGMRNQVSK